MDNNKLNSELIEKFGELEQLCNQIYCDKHGVTSYIDEMIEKRALGEVYVRNWELYLTALRGVRHKRNMLAHGEKSFSESCATPDDITFTDNFREELLKGSDPLATLEKEHKRHLQKAKQQLAEKSRMSEQKQSVASTRRTNEEENAPKFSKRAAIALWIIIAAALAAVICFLATR